jgi:hypothetical protein
MTRLQRIADIILKRWRKEGNVELQGIVYTVDEGRGIDDGDYHRPTNETDIPGWLVETWNDDGGREGWEG